MAELRSSNKSFWELLSKTKYTLRDFLVSLKKLYVNGDIIVSNDGSISKRSKAFDSRTINFVSKRCEKCVGKGINFYGLFQEVFKKYKEAMKTRPQPTLKYSQGYMNERDVIARIALMHYHNDLEGKSIAFIGDDDLVSVAAALTRLPSRILVLDIDQRIGEFIYRMNEKYNLQIEYKRYDVFNTLPKSISSSFDVVSSEPLETLKGFKTFLDRGIDCLRKKGSGYFGLTTIESSAYKWHKIEKHILEKNCVITDVMRDFSYYHTRYPTVNYEKFTSRIPFPVGVNPGIDWYRSSLIRFELL